MARKQRRREDLTNKEPNATTSAPETSGQDQQTRIIAFSDTARQALETLANQNPDKHRKVLKTLGLMQTNLRHPGLHTHEFNALTGPNGEKIFEAYVENRTPSAYRIFWHYGPDRGTVTVLAITPHP